MPNRSRPGAFTLVPLLAAALLVAGCSSPAESGTAAPSPVMPSASGSASAGPSPLATGDPMALTVLVYNVEYGGSAATDKVIRTVGADVVGVLESYNRLPEMARRTGYPYYNVGLQLLSKFPILEPSDADGLHALIEVRPGYAVPFFNTHLDYVRYGPRLLARGMAVDAVVASENAVRMSSMAKQLPAIGELLAAGQPVILTGDFNEPSHLDYTAETVGTRPGLSEVVPWPVSEALVEAGMRDTFREAHPDPVAVPGLTWGVEPDGSGNRIDYVYAGGPVTVMSSRLIGRAGDEGVDVGFPRWTSDHRAVVSDLQVTPVALPTMVSLDRRMLTVGDELTVYHRQPPPGGGSVEVARDDGTVATREDGLVADGRFAVDTADLGPGEYQVVLRGAGGNVLARNAFTVRSAVARVTISTDKATYAVGEPIVVSWTDGPANRWDWIGVYRASAADPDEDDYLLWAYSGLHDSGAVPPTVDGRLTLGTDSMGKPWPLPPGDYVAYYLLTDQYEHVGEARFTVAR